jgi:hypothetical protein
MFSRRLFCRFISRFKYLHLPAHHSIAAPALSRPFASAASPSGSAPSVQALQWTRAASDTLVTSARPLAPSDASHDGIAKVCARLLWLPCIPLTPPLGRDDSFMDRRHCISSRNNILSRHNLCNPSCVPFSPAHACAAAWWLQRPSTRCRQGIHPHESNTLQFQNRSYVSVLFAHWFSSSQSQFMLPSLYLWHSLASAVPLLCCLKRPQFFCPVRTGEVVFMSSVVTRRLEALHRASIRCNITHTRTHTYTMQFCQQYGGQSVSLPSVPHRPHHQLPRVPSVAHYGRW